MKYTILAVLAGALLTVTGCDKNQGAAGNDTTTTKETINQQKDSVDASAKEAKKRTEANADATKAQIEADKDAAKAQLDAEKKKVDAAK
jgi:hypothetical protein